MPSADTHRVRLFELPDDYDTRPIGDDRKPRAPVEVPGFAVDAPSHDLARAAVEKRLGEYGYTRVRSVSALVGGGFVAIVYPAPKEKH